jgi:hypothetical protein
VEAAKAEYEEAKSDTSTYDCVITNEDLDTAYKALEEYIYGDQEVGTNGIHGDGATKDSDVTMVEGGPNGSGTFTNGDKMEAAQKEVTNGG